MRSDRNYFLDFLRGVFSLMVVVYHYFTLSSADGKLSIWRSESLTTISKYGYLGVDLFFVISGAVIIFSSKRKNALSFIKGRFIRLYPEYWLSIVFTVLIVYFIGENYALNFSSKDVIINFTMFQRFFGIADVNGVYWTLAIELIFYFFISVVLLLRKMPMYYLFFFLSVLNLFSLFFQELHFLRKYLILDWMTSFTYGFLIYKFTEAESAKNYGNITLLILNFIVHILILKDQLIRHENYLGLTLNYYVELVIYYTGIILIYISFIVKINSISLIRLSTLFGRLSYPVYLTHGVGIILISKFLNDHFGLDRWILLFVSVVFLIWFSLFITWLSERFRSKLLKYLKGNRINS